MSAGTGLLFLRECVFYNDFNLLRTCAIADQRDSGLLTFTQFRDVLKATRYNFTDAIVEDLIKDSPRTLQGEVRYKELVQKVEGLGMPRSYLTLIPTQPKVASVDDMSKILDEKGSIFSLLKQEELQNFGLGGLDLKTLRDKDLQREDPRLANLADTFEIHNMRVLLLNFPIYLSQSVVSAALKGKTDMPDSVRMEFMFKLLDMKSVDMHRNFNG